MGKINVAIIGAGNCASSLVQGLYKYSEVDETSEKIPGLMHNILGGYALSDVNIVAAFDVAIFYSLCPRPIRQTSAIRITVFPSFCQIFNPRQGFGELLLVHLKHVLFTLHVNIRFIQ